ncbi:glutaconate CoA-transferase subunit B [Thalassobacillus cyri]|uniref:Glutaconate CoA-transferase subunit B n=1 Tax=Thalassobacillus cyri TaxID=571932 RepID=A0A1H3ZE79_9BACI|nr:CoA-transferase [Thalassobacillus cyri]SEA21945.1 glutaconate CoA-transferase subunit B [Thalassobacillus cyri]
MDYTTGELMVVAAAREIQDEEVVFVGMRLPMLAFAVAKRTHAPNVVGFYECGIVRDFPSEQLLYTMGDTPNIEGAQWCTSTNHLMFLMQQGNVDCGFIGGAEIDRFGNVNTSYIGNHNNPKVKLPGSGGAADIAGLSNRLLVIMNHEKRRLTEKVDYITSPGAGEGGNWREEQGIPRGGIGSLITTLGVMRPGGNNELELASIHPGIALEEVKENTGWDLKAGNNLTETDPPKPEELDVIRSIDPDGFWTG